MGRRNARHEHWRELAAAQAGVFTTSQGLAWGMTRDQLRAVAERERWQRLYRGVYLTNGGATTSQQRLWAGLLVCGPGAALSHGSAAFLHGLFDRPAEAIQVTIPAQRRVRAPAGVSVYVCARLAERVHPALVPARTTLEHTVLDLAHSARGEATVLDVVMRACRERRTTPARLLGIASARPRLSHRALLEAVLSDVAAGAHSPLERRYLHDVERAHGLPRSTKQQRCLLNEATIWRDVVYEEFGTVVELDGRLGHEAEPFRDLERDNAALVRGLAPLRYGWWDTITRPCAVAGQVAEVLRAGGWTGRSRRCSATCAIDDP